MFSFRQKNKYNIDVNTAGEMLQNVFAACDTTPNRVPFDKIVLRSKQNFFTDKLYVSIATALFILTMFLPIFLPHSDVRVSKEADMRSLAVKEHALDSMAFSISFDGAPLDMNSSYMLSNDDTVIKPWKYESETNTIVFPYSEGEYNIYVYDIEGRSIHLLLSPR